MNYKDIHKLPRANYNITVHWSCLEDWLQRQDDDGILDLDPDFQRHHVWTAQQQSNYIEYILTGGESSREILFNCQDYVQGNVNDTMVLVDGKQRLEAVRLWLRDDREAFGVLRREIKGLRSLDLYFNIRVCDLPTRREVLHWYLSLNSGGTDHTVDEIERVRQLLEEESNE